uniref:MFS transporter n=1 Tax=Vibrio algicola TaxID=2662262 RepID=A0A5Q0TDM9_9VIBR
MSSSLLKKRRFLPYFITQFLGAFNDNIFKNTLLLLVAFAAVDTLPVSSDIFINLAAGLFILPFFLFSATAGVLADNYEKSKLIRIIKMAEVIIMLLAAIGFLFHSYLSLLILLFLMGTQSAFFGPVKYALLPQHLKAGELVSGNALVETGTFLAILFGTIGAGFIAGSGHAEVIAAVMVIIFAILGFIASNKIPAAPAEKSHQPFQWQPITQTQRTLAIAKQNNHIYLSILAISWFWFLGACYLTQFPNFTKHYLLGNQASVSLLLTLFSVGIAVGSLLCARLSRHQVNLKLVLLGGALISVCSFLLGFSTPSAITTSIITPSSSLWAFIAQPSLWGVFISLFGLGISGGLFIVPLYTQMQILAQPNQRAQVIAANNIYNAIFMVASALISIICLAMLNLSIPDFFELLAACNAVVIFLLWYKAASVA